MNLSRTVERARWWAPAPVALLRDPTSAPHARGWLRSLRHRRTPLGERVPFFSYKARTWLTEVLDHSSRVFEYGSGGSTLFFAGRCREVVAVEHDREWFERIENELQRDGLSNVHYLLQEPSAAASGAIPPYSTTSCTSSEERYAGVQFDDYVHSIDAFEEKSFDLVLVDGRARPSCAAAALPKIRRGGFLVLDNSNRDEYRVVHELMGGFRKISFKGIQPFRREISHTTAWEMT